MFGLDYMTIGGYIMDGYALCPECGDKEGASHENSYSVAQLESDWADDGGLTCDTCGEYIVEPNEEEDEDSSEEFLD